MIEFLSLKKVTAKYADEIHEAVNRVVDSGWYLQGVENEKFDKDFAEFIGTTNQQRQLLFVAQNLKSKN